ncbi:hypothetical protein PPYR_12124 [Photinus pyralis]|uniref:CUB domain-containing protein n=2 Tax=Photinus pyralis TaxID=7054 RepID=A0A5N4AD93_PHOPY|nr:uncharacterized protein LOC116176945 isoform X1 [Photinus pyralis]KAB0795285.1 hypothetical protein PPYR_12124 [Photinus pyralis]
MKLCGLFFLVISLGYWKNSLAFGTVITRELCDQSYMLNLAPTGRASSVTILLNPKDQKKVCRLNITAPTSHVINLQWQKEAEEQENDTLDSSPCPLSVFLPDYRTVSVWKGNPCMKEKLPDVDLLTPNLMLTWNPPRFAKHVRGRKLIITAVGQDEVCIQKRQHVCMRIGWKPMLCISEELVCDGNLNCPKGSSRSDEDPVLCKSFSLDRSSWKRVAEGVIGKNKSEKQEDLMSLKDVKSYEVTLPDHDHHDTGDSVSAAIAHYGTWGYLMLAMLIVGTILMFCGLWECCFRKPKPQLDLQPAAPSTTVLIINRTQDSSGTRPPNYDELDQPPPYAALFPHNKTKVERDNVIRRHEPVTEESVNEAFSSACDSSDEQSDSYVSIDDSSNRLYNSSSSNELERVSDRHTSPVFCIVTSM